MKLKKIAVTMGEPGGIGPEVTVKALCRDEVRRCCSPLVIGDADIIRQAVRLAGLPLRVNAVSNISDSENTMGVIDVLDISSRKAFKRRAPSANAGRAVVGYITQAVDLAMNKEVSAIVTAPISKESMKMAGYRWPGHTELLAELTGTKDFAMMFVSKRLRVILCTIHVPLKNVPKMIKKGLVLRTIMLAQRGAEMLGSRDPRIAVAGLNPHAGEAGILGREEASEIIPAVQKAQRSGLSVSGPYPPDVIFHKAYHGDLDIIVCMYHDQGLIPFKMISFDTGVNMTVGLPIIRTSPDHGTAFDIAWQNRAEPASMIEAIKLAVKLRL